MRYFLLQFCINGLAAAASYFLVGLGVALVMKVCQRLDISLAGWMGVGAYGILLGTMRGSFFVASIMVFLVVFGLGLVQQRYLYTSVRNAGVGRAGLIMSLGILIILQNCLAILFGSDRSSLEATRALLVEGKVVVTVLQGLEVFAGLSALAVLSLSSRTQVGREIAAIADDPTLAKDLGIPVTARRSLCFGVAVVLVGGAGVLLGAQYGLVPWLGLRPLLRGLTAAVVGGWEPSGVLVGAVVVGLLEHVSAMWIPTVWQDLVVFALLIIFLFFRPQAQAGWRRRHGWTM